MKKLTIVFALIVLGTATVFAQDSTPVIPKKNALKANPLGMIIGIGKINYERRLSNTSSVQLGVSYFNYTSDGEGITGLGLVPEYRFYISQEALSGFYVAPFLKYNNITVKDGDDGFEGTLNAYRGGAKAGMNWLLGKKDNFVIDLAFGAKYSDFNLKVKEGSESDFENEGGFSGISPELHFAIGFAF